MIARIPPYVCYFLFCINSACSPLPHRSRYDDICFFILNILFGVNLCGDSELGMHQYQSRLGLVHPYASPEGDTASHAEDAVSPAGALLVSPNFGICDTTR